MQTPCCSRPDWGSITSSAFRHWRQSEASGPTQDRQDGWQSGSRGSQAQRGQILHNGSEKSTKVGGGRVLTVAGAVLGVEPLPTRVHTLALVQEEPTRTGGALGHRGTPA